MTLRDFEGRQDVGRSPRASKEAWLFAMKFQRLDLSSFSLMIRLGKDALYLSSTEVICQLDGGLSTELCVSSQRNEGSHCSGFFSW